MADRIAEEPEYIIILQSFEAVVYTVGLMTNAIGLMMHAIGQADGGGIDLVANRGIYMATAAILHLAKRMKIKQIADKRCHEPYHNILPQATDRVKCL
jgi:hypothetical protein